MLRRPTTSRPAGQRRSQRWVAAPVAGDTTPPPPLCPLAAPSYPPLGPGAKEGSWHSCATQADAFGQPFDSIALPCCSSGSGAVSPSLLHSDANTHCGPSRLGAQPPLPPPVGEQQRSPQAPQPSQQQELPPPPQQQQQEEQRKQCGSPAVQPQPLAELQRAGCVEAAAQPHLLQPSSPHGGGRSASLGPSGGRPAPSLGTSSGRVCKQHGQVRERLPEGGRRYQAAQLTLQILEQEVSGGAMGSQLASQLPCRRCRHWASAAPRPPPGGAPSASRPSCSPSGLNNHPLAAGVPGHGAAGCGPPPGLWLAHNAEEAGEFGSWDVLQLAAHAFPARRAATQLGLGNLPSCTAHTLPPPPHRLPQMKRLGLVRWPYRLRITCRVMVENAEVSGMNPCHLRAPLRAAGLCACLLRLPHRHARVCGKCLGYRRAADFLKRPCRLSPLLRAASDAPPPAIPCPALLPAGLPASQGGAALRGGGAGQGGGPAGVCAAAGGDGPSRPQRCVAGLRRGAILQGRLGWAWCEHGVLPP